jgi:hypothetical protein
LFAAAVWVGFIPYCIFLIWLLDISP